MQAERRAQKAFSYQLEWPMPINSCHTGFRSSLAACLALFAASLARYACTIENGTDSNSLIAAVE